MKKALRKTYAIGILIPLAVGVLSALLSGNLRGTYMALSKPPFSPPPIVFPIVWTILYVLMGVGSVLVVTQEADMAQKAEAIRTYVVQLLLNFCWPIFFFRLEAYWLAAAWLVALIYAVFCMTVQFFRCRRLAGWLQLPCFLWCIFALYLNLGVALLN